MNIIDMVNAMIQATMMSDEKDLKIHTLQEEVSLLEAQKIEAEEEKDQKKQGDVQNLDIMMRCTISSLRAKGGMVVSAPRS